MNVTVVIPILNEEKSIDALIEALTKQLLLPVEVIIVDGGSKDKTIEKIKNWQDKKIPFSLSLMERGGANRSLARNIGIKQADTEIIALTDAGCAPKKDWLEKLIEPFKNNKQMEVVAGFYDPAPKNWWEDILADYTCVREWNFNPETFLPSSRSIAFTKKIWEQVGGYPEELDTCEDLVFAEKLKKQTKHWRVVKEAQVVWDQPKSLTELSHKIYGYALGDLDAQYERHVKKIYSAVWRIVVLLFVMIPAIFIGRQYIRLFGGLFLSLYILASIAKHARMLRYLPALFVLPIFQLTVDIALIQALIFHKMSARYK